jgi:hypothetical protein
MEAEGQGLWRIHFVPASAIAAVAAAEGDPLATYALDGFASLHGQALAPNLDQSTSAYIRRWRIASLSRVD